MSLKMIPGFGKSGISRIALIKTVLSLMLRFMDYLFRCIKFCLGRQDVKAFMAYAAKEIVFLWRLKSNKRVDAPFEFFDFVLETVSFGTVF